MSNIETISKVILQETCNIKYSVSGYNDELDAKDPRGYSLDNELIKSFKIIKKSFENNKEAISFISFADTELKENNVDKWIVEADKGKFFYAAIENSNDSSGNNAKDEVLNDYYYFKDVLKWIVDKERWPGTDVEKQLLSIPRSAQLAYVLNEPFTYRILCTDEVNEIELNYNEVEKLLVVIIPNKWLNMDSKEIIDIKEYKPIKYNEKVVSYEIDKQSKKGDYYSTHADTESLKEHIISISNELRFQKVPIKKESEQSTDIYSEGFARLIISLAYLSKLLNCWVESIPSVVAYVNNQPKCLGVFIWGYYGDKNTKESPYSLYFQQFSDKLCACYANKYIKPLQSAKQVRKAAIKSAVADIMSRNMSHNLGSHYLYYTKNQLSSLADKHDEVGPEIRGAARVMGYMQARMDYLATIVANDESPYGGVYLKGQIFDVLTIDDFSKRHFDNSKQFKRTTNYLLQNIILSEDFTREPVVTNSTREPLDTIAERTSMNNFDKEQLELSRNSKNRLKNWLKRFVFRKKRHEELPENDAIDDNNQKLNVGSDQDAPKQIIRLKVILPNGNEFSGVGNNEKEQKQKLEFSKICVALPGSVMSIHAFFNVVENIMRNSAKYMKEDLDGDLIITIAINKLEPSRELPHRYEFVIYDNKKNAKSDTIIEKEGKLAVLPLMEAMNEKLKKLQILESNNVLEKSDKGIKEMLFSILWMCAYSYSDHHQKLADILTDIDNMNDKDKFKTIKEHAFEFVAVDNNGKVVSESIDDNKLKDVVIPDEANLGIRFSLPEFRMMKLLSKDDLQSKNFRINNFSDIICVQEKPFNELKKVFTRVYFDKDKDVTLGDANNVKYSIKALKYVLDERFGNINNYKMSISSKKEKGYKKIKEESKYCIYFETHLSKISEMKKYLYSEAISGGNFTKTIESMLENGIDSCGKYTSDEAEYFGLKVKESALTKITLIDERFYNDMKATKDKDFYLSCKNVRLLNLKSEPPSQINNEVKDLFDGNMEDRSDETLFLSIHLGLIEKILGNNQWCKAFGIADKPKNDRPKALMDFFYEKFNRNGELFISVHSGRGNLSKDLEGPLKNYPFISISALESVLSNSKFLLSQLFYNTVYYSNSLVSTK